MSVEDFLLNAVNEKVVKSFKFFDDRKRRDEGFVVKGNDVKTLFWKRSEEYRNEFSITAQRTQCIPKHEIRNSNKILQFPLDLYDILTTGLKDSDDCFTMQLFKSGSVVGLCCFILYEKYTYVRALAITDDVSRKSVGHCFFSIIEDIVLTQKKKCNPVITFSIKEKNDDKTHNVCWMDTFFEQKLSTRFDPKSKTFSFNKDQKKMNAYIDSNVSTDYETVNWISYIPAFICNTSRVYRNINCDIRSWSNLIKYCYNNILKVHVCEKHVQNYCKYSSVNSSNDWNHWMKNHQPCKKYWVPYLQTEKRVETEKRCVEVLLHKCSSRINGVIESFVKKKHKIEDEGNNDIFQIMSLIVFGEKEKHDLFRQFFSALWLTLSLATAAVFDDSMLNDYEKKTIVRYVIHMKKRNLTRNYQTRIWNDDKLKRMLNEYKTSNETRLEIHMLISNSYLENAFPAGIDDLTLILNIYNFDALYIYSNINVHHDSNMAFYPEGPYINCCLKYQLINSDVNVLSKDNSQRLIIPIALCNVSKSYDIKLYNVKYSLNLSMNNLHIHVETFEEKKSTWNELRLIMDDNMNFNIFQYDEYCCKPNHFQIKNEVICPVIPGNEFFFLSSVDYLKYIKKDIGSKVNISVIDVVEETEVIWSFNELIKYFAKTEREKLYNQVSLEISSLPIRKRIQIPKFVQEIDWISNEKLNKSKFYSKIQCYFITSVIGCYMDFHIDLSGSSVWYHVFIGMKEFCLIQPTVSNLETYENWLTPNEVNKIFLPDLIEDVTTISYVKVCPGQTLIIPSGYIHAVYTAEDSIVYGGNFLHSNSVEMQFSVYTLEQRKKIPVEQRIEFFVELNLYVCDYFISKSMCDASVVYDKKAMLKILLGCRNCLEKGYNSTEMKSCELYLLRRYAISNMAAFFHMAIYYCENEFANNSCTFLRSVNYVQHTYSITFYVNNYYECAGSHVSIDKHLYTYSINSMFTSIVVCPITGECYKSAPKVGMTYKMFRSKVSIETEFEADNDCQEVFDFEKDYYIFKTVYEAEECAKAFAFDCINFRNWFKFCISNFVRSSSLSEKRNDMYTQFTIESPYHRKKESIMSSNETTVLSDKKKFCLKLSANNNIKNLDNNHSVFECFVVDMSDITRRNNDLLMYSGTKRKMTQTLTVPLNFILAFPFQFDLSDLYLQNLKLVLFHSSSSKNINNNNTTLFPNGTTVNSWNNRSRVLFKIDSNDANRLCKKNDDGCLNDALIEFWLMWISLIFNKDKCPIHCCKSFMYTQLIGEHLKYPSVQYERVKQFCNSKLFEKAMILIPINVKKQNHWIIAIILNPSSYVLNHKDFNIIICDSLFTGKDQKKDINQYVTTKQTIVNNLLYWLREEWYLINMSRKCLMKRNVKQSIYTDKIYIPFYSKGQENIIDCGVFVCLYAYETVQWLLDTTTNKNKNKTIYDYLNKVNQAYVTKFRQQMFELVICLESKHSTVTKSTNLDTMIEGDSIIDDDNDDCVMLNESEVTLLKKNNLKTKFDNNTYVNNNNQCVVLNESEVEFLPKKSFLNLRNEIEMCTKSNCSSNANKQTEVDDKNIAIIDVCEVASVKTSNVKKNKSAVTVVSECNSGNLSFNKYNNVNMDEANLEPIHISKNSESNLQGKEINMKTDEDDISSVSASLDQSMSIISSSTNTSKKRKAHSHLKTNKKINLEVVEERVRIQYVRAVLTFTCSKETIFNFLDGKHKSYESLKNSRIEHNFYWYIYCYPKLKTKNHRYTILSEYVLIQTTTENTVSEWKAVVFDLFQESRKNVSHKNDSDDVRDVDYFNSYQNRGKVNAWNVFYIECEDNMYNIDIVYMKYQWYYYNMLKNIYYSISVTENDRTKIEECEEKWLTDTHGVEFCKHISKMWFNINTNTSQHLYVTFPGYIIPYPMDYEQISVNITLPYSDACQELAPFVLASNCFYLMKEMSLARITFENRISYYNKLIENRNNYDVEKFKTEEDFIKSDLNVTNEKFDRPFHDLTKICTKHQFKSIVVNHKFDLLRHHELMLGDEMVIFCLKSNACYLCVTKDYILSSNMKQPVKFSKYVLDIFSYGMYIGIKQGLYICRRKGNNSFLTKFVENYDHKVFKVGSD